MELEEIQATWGQLSKDLEQQKKLTEQIIMEMTQERYSNKFTMIATYESLGALICYIAGIYMLANFGKLDIWYLKACGVFTMAFLFVMPILILKALYRIKNIDILKSDCKETFVRFTKAKKSLLVLQQIGICASFLLMFSSAAVFSKIWSNRDFFMVDRGVSFYVAVSVALLFVLFILRWGYRHYVRATASAERMIKTWSKR